ncbi:MAG: outer membrane protein assembly factor BamD [Acidobacteria bacterium]|nr:outer membrane protein assembly factor BamD [Acidobacteriota bacterium]
MRFRNLVLTILCAAVLLPTLPLAPAFGRGTQSGATAMQRIDVLRSRLDSMRRTLNSAIAGLNAGDDGKKAAADSPRARLSGLEKEVGALLSEVNDIRGKQERAERYDATQLDKLETALTDLDTRVQAAMRETAGERRATVATSEMADSRKKKKGGFFGRILGRGGDEKYSELIGTVAPGRDRELFEVATKEARKDNYEEARSLYGVIINTYPDSSYLPLSKLAIADTFYLEGTTGALIQAAQAYQDWLTFFPTAPLADDVMLKMAEVEMRRMGLPDRDVTSAKKAEQRLKAILQQFPNTSLRPDVEIRLREVQEVLAMHNKKVGDLYYDRYFQRKAANPKGAQMRYREIAEKWPNFCQMDTVLYRLATTYVQEEEPDEAAKHLQRLVRDYPNSELADKAREQLAAIGSPVPDPDPTKANLPPCESVSFVGGIMQEITGATPKTLDKNGVIIGTDDKAADLIQKAIENNGAIPDSYTTQPVRRVAPARRLESTTPPPPAQPKTEKKAITLAPTQPGPPKTGGDPTKPAATQPTTPATPPPGGGVKP